MAKPKRAAAAPAANLPRFTPTQKQKLSGEGLKPSAIHDLERALFFMVPTRSTGTMTQARGELRKLEQHIAAVLASLRHLGLTSGTLAGSKLAWGMMELRDGPDTPPHLRALASAGVWVDPGLMERLETLAAGLARVGGWKQARSSNASEAPAVVAGVAFALQSHGVAPSQSGNAGKRFANIVKLCASAADARVTAASIAKAVRNYIAHMPRRKAGRPSKNAKPTPLNHANAVALSMARTKLQRLQRSS